MVDVSPTPPICIPPVVLLVGCIVIAVAVLDVLCSVIVPDDPPIVREFPLFPSVNADAVVIPVFKNVAPLVPEELKTTRPAGAIVNCSTSDPALFTVLNPILDVLLACAAVVQYADIRAISCESVVLLSP